MTTTIPESDWKIFRQLHPVAVDRYCQKVLHDMERIAADSKKTPHQRYLAIYKLIERRDRDMSRAFDELRRSTALTQLAIIYSYGVVTEDEIMRFTPETRGIVSFLSTPRD